jgi:hypothetical protein
MQMREHSGDAAVLAGGLGDVDLDEESADVGLDGPVTERQALGDAGVRQAFSHQGSTSSSRSLSA